MTKVKGWLELYLWMNEQRQVEIKTNFDNKVAPKEKRTIVSDLKNSGSNSKIKNQRTS